MDPTDAAMDPQDLQEVRKIIEKSTSKVSLRDLEKKGFRKVKVLRSNDIDELIRRAVHAVVAREGVGGPSSAAQQEEIVQKSKEELRSLMAAAQAAEAERAELAAEKEALEQQVRELRARQQHVGDLEGKLKEIQRRLADEEDSRRRAEAQLEAMRRRLADAEAQLESARRRAEEAEARALAYQSLRDEADELRSRMKQVETERRLIEELEVPKLRERIQGLEADLRAARAAAHAAAHSAAPAMSDERMKAMFRELLTEIGAGRATGVDPAIKEEFAKMQRAIAESLARAGGRGAVEVTEADLEAAKLSIAQIFAAEAAKAGVESNIAAVEVKETTAASNVKQNLDRLKSLRKGGSS